MSDCMVHKEESLSEGSLVNSNDDAVLPKSSFVTTSDVLEQLNKQLSGLSAFDGTGSNPQEQKEKPRFELQRRLPDGSTIPATKDEIAAADFKSKLEQSAKFISQLQSPEDRQYWAEQQRLSGNAFFQQGDYKSAMDIYLTCLVVKENTPDFVRKTFLPVLNNLAQCTLQLGMHMKTITFCEMALEEVSKAKERAEKTKNIQVEKKVEETDEHKLFIIQRDFGDAIALCKIFFKLAKALRLTGHYEKSRKALGRSLDCLTGEENEIIASSYVDANDPQFSLTPYKKAIKKECRHLDIAEKEAKRNLARQKRAMQALLSTPPMAKQNSTETQAENETRERSSLSNSLYENSCKPRQFSNLRSPKFKTSSSDLQRADDRNSFDDSSYTQYYWTMVARVCEKLLEMVDGKDDVDNDKNSKLD